MSEHTVASVSWSKTTHSPSLPKIPLPPSPFASFLVTPSSSSSTFPPLSSRTPCSMVQVTAQGQWDDITGRLRAACLLHNNRPLQLESGTLWSLWERERSTKSKRDGGWETEGEKRRGNCTAQLRLKEGEREEGRCSVFPAASVYACVWTLVAMCVCKLRGAFSLCAYSWVCVGRTADCAAF